jgi:hypothetical protein
MIENLANIFAYLSTVPLFTAIFFCDMKLSMRTWRGVLAKSLSCNHSAAIKEWLGILL